MKNTTRTIGKIASLGLAGILATTTVSTKADDGESPSAGAADVSVEKETFSLKPSNFSVGTSWHSRYMGTYGFTLSEGPVIQSDMGFNIGKLSYNLWGNYDMKNGLNELDNSLTLNLETENFRIRPEFYWFTFPNTELEDAYTLGVSVQTKKLPVDVTFTAVQSYGEISHEGQLFQLKLSKNFPLTDRLTLGVESRLSYNNRYFVPDSGFSVAAIGLNVGADLGRGYSLNAGVRAQKAIDDMHGVFKDHAATFDLSLRKSW
ncbi:MAG: hypothetical protein Q8Q31_00490 [Nanoarchaeota archaeon]|nr:hypothetical protein [Nanoarchaeota archaeon]